MNSIQEINKNTGSSLNPMLMKHLTEIFVKILIENPIDSYENFELLSKEIKMNSFEMKKDESVVKISQDTHVQNTKALWADKKLMQFKFEVGFFILCKILHIS